MTQYDNTNKGVMFQPYDDQRLVLQGKLDIEGNELRVIGIRQPLTKDGDPVIVLYEQAGVLYPNDQKGNDKAPEYSGPLDRHANLRVAGWKGEKNGNHYLQLKVSEKQSRDNTSVGTDPFYGDSEPFNSDDEVPF